MLQRVQKSILMLLGGILIAGTVQARIVAPKAAVSGILGSEAAAGAILTYVKETDGFIYYVDLNAAVLTEKLLCNDVTPAISPLISPDGRMVTFADISGKYYVCALSEDATAYELGTGFDPHWWVNGDSTFILYCSNTGKLSWPMPGKTYRQRIVWDAAAPQTSGAPLVVANYSFNGGLSKTGAYLCTAYDDVVMYDNSGSTQIILNKGIQACNASITPTTSTGMYDDAEMMILSLGGAVGGVIYQQHEIFYILDRFDAVRWSVTNPPSTTEWQKPEWSTNKNFAVATALHGINYHVYIVRTYEDDDYIEVVDGNNTYPHLWVAATTPVKHSSAPVTEQLGMTLSSLPAFGEALTITFAAAVTGDIALYSADGVQVYATQVAGNAVVVPVAGLDVGVYMVQGVLNGHQVVRTILIGK